MNTHIDLSHEGASSWSEWGIVIALALLASVYLWRKFRRSKKGGCSSCCSQGGCCSTKKTE